MTLNAAFQQRFNAALDHQRQSQPMKCIVAKSGYSIDYIRRMKRGDQSNPSLLFVEAMAQTLGVSVAWLLGLEGITDEVSKRNVLEG